MNDMSSVIIPKSDQLNADDMISGPMTVTIADVRITPGSEQPVSIVLEGTDKFYRPCKSMSRVLVGAWGADAKAYIGRSLTLYRDPEVKWGGMAVGGIRISHMSDIDGAKVMVLTATKGSRKPHKVLPIEGAPKSDAKPDPAAKYAAGFIAKLASFETIEAVDAFVIEKVAKLSELQTARPELHKDVMDAIAARKAAIAPSTFDDDDLTDDGPSPAETAANAWCAEFGKAETVDALKAAYARSELDRSMMSDELRETVEKAYEDNSARLKPVTAKVEA